MADRVRTNQIKSRRSKESCEDTTTATAKDDDPFTFVDKEPEQSKASSSGRVPWDPEETNLLRERFLQEETCPGVRRMMLTFKETTELWEIYVKNGK